MWPFSGMSLENASTAGTLANWVLLASLVAGVMATFVIVKTADVKEEYWAEDRKKSAERIAELNKETQRLSTDAEASRASVAEANARTLEAQLALDRFKAPRSLSESDKTLLATELLKFAGTNAAIYVLGDGPEPNGLGASILDALTRAHWNVLSWNWSGVGAPSGVIVLPKPGSDVSIDDTCTSLVTALKSVQLAAIKQSWPGDWEHFGGMLNGPNPPAPTAAPIRVVIGTKPQ